MGCRSERRTLKRRNSVLCAGALLAMDWHRPADFDITLTMKTTKQKRSRPSTAQRKEPTRAARILILPKKGSPLGEARIREAINRVVAERERQSA